MVYVLSAIFSKLAFIAINIVWMRLRRRHVATRAVLALYIFSVPLLLAVGAYQIWVGHANLEPAYWGYVAAWAIICCLLNLMNVYTYKYASLIELSTYRFSIMVIVAFIVDYFFLDMPISLPMAGLVFITLAGGTILNFERARFLQTGTSSEKVSLKNNGLYKMLALISVISVLSVLDLEIFKKALAIQDNFIFHAAAAQSLLFLMFFSYGGIAMNKSLGEGKIRLFEAGLITVLIVIATMFEAYSYVALPVVIIVLLGVCQPLIFSIHDFITKELPLNFRTAASCLMIIAGIIGISLVKNGFLSG